MNPEDIIGGTEKDLEARRAEQVTLRHLLNVIANKTVYSKERDGRTGADLVKPGDMYGVATVYRIEKGVDGDGPSRVAQIHRQERVGNNGDRIITNWFILDTPDGLHIEKHTQTGDNEYIDDDATLEEAHKAALNGLAKIVELQKAQKIEDELGLSFVSEKEARDLLLLLDPLEPFRWVTD